MIQILGLREYTGQDGVTRVHDNFSRPEWKVSDIFELFGNLDAYLGMIPEAERWNMFYTIANCTDKKREFFSQDVIPIDIDGITKGMEPRIVSTVCAELGLDPSKIGVVYSGNGVHLLIGLHHQIESLSYLNTNKPYYRALAGRVNQCLFEAGLSGTADTTVFSGARILRLPNTKNVKRDKGITDCVLINGKIERLNIDLFTLADMPKVDLIDQISPKIIGNMPTPDNDAIIDGCSFLRHCRDTEENLPEPMWYAMLSITGRMVDGEELSQEFSMPKGLKHSKYTAETSRPRTKVKLEHALEASGPRTCNNISYMYEGCKSCPNFHKVTSPIQITGEDTIRTQSFGFYEMVLNKNGERTQGKPNYDDLARWYKKNHEYISIEETQSVMTYTGTHWEHTHRSRIHAFAEDNFSPKPTNNMCMEFESKLSRTNLIPLSEINEMDLLNFKNGVLNTSTGEMHLHSPTYKFDYVIPYAYEPKGDCPIFKKFLNEVACDDEEVAQALAEYIGYCISGTDPELVQKCALLYGEGANGKSVLINLMRELVGPQNCSAMGMDSIKKENYRHQLMGKLFNASAESPRDSFLDSEIFKQMVTGDTVEVRKLYSEPAMWKCTTKLMFACNELPFSGDFSNGIYRRLLILPFRNEFTDEKGNKDPLIGQKMLTERSDIFKYCLDQFAKCKARGYQLTTPRASVEELEDYRELGDVVSRFVYGMCEFVDGIEGREIKQLDQIYNMFAIWCKENNQTLLSYGSFSRRFGKVLMKRYPKIERSRPRDDEGRKGTGYRFLAIKAMTPF